MLLEEREIILCIDETGERKKGKTTDYVTRQYIGNLVSIQATYFQLEAKSNQQSTFELDTSVNQIPAYS